MFETLFLYRDYIPVENSDLDIVDSDAVTRTAGNNTSVEGTPGKFFSDPVNLLNKKDLYYNMNYGERGCFMIFNYKVGDKFFVCINTQSVINTLNKISITKLNY